MIHWPRFLCDTDRWDAKKKEDTNGRKSSLADISFFLSALFRNFTFRPAGSLFRAPTSPRHDNSSRNSNREEAILLSLNREQLVNFRDEIFISTSRRRRRKVSYKGMEICPPV